MRNATLLLLSFVSLNSFAGAIEQVEIDGQPNAIFSGGKASLCGLRLMVLSELTQDKKGTTARTYDLSMSMQLSGAVIVKGLAWQMQSTTGAKPNAKKLPIKSVWIKSENGTATIPNQGKVIVGDDNISILYVDEKLIDKYLEFIKTIAERRPLLMGVRVRAGEDEKLLTGVVKLSEPDERSFTQCNVELTKLMAQQAQ
jgi:hypothetical protein